MRADDRQAAVAGSLMPLARLVPLGDTPPEIVTLNGGPLLIGRAADCGLVCQVAGISRHHARIARRRGAWQLEDLGSANGTALDGRPVTGSVPLKQGAVIRLGASVTYRFEILGAATATRPSVLDPFFCLQLKPTTGGRTFVLRRSISVVGRNAEADLRLDSPQISGIHARILRRGGRVLLRDTSSRNGTTVNGETVHEARLRPGDRVAFGDQLFTVGRSAVPTTRALLGLTAATLVTAAAVVLVVLLSLPGSGVEPLWTREMYLDQVTTSLVAAVRAHDVEPPARELALAQLDIARRSLIAADLLRPDRQTPAEVLAALTEAARAPAVARLLGRRAIGAIVSDLEKEPEAPPPPTDPRRFDLESELSFLMAEFGIDTRDTPIPSSLVRDVDRFTRFWSRDQRDYTLRSRQRGLPLLADMRRELRRNRLPEVFCYLPFIESGYQTHVTSRAGARGLWQLMPGTARDYGLRVDEPDERTDPVLSTQAACRHLDMLLEIFGPESFMCAVAAYNKGHNGLRRCLAEFGDQRSPWRFWDLVSQNRGCLKPETVEYVPRFLAAVVVFRNPEHFGL
ncbi:MAG: FHA domain-containing protein [bacterium]|nr:FHA domain-containing protein [bacterium]